MSITLSHPSSASAIEYLERRSSYMAKAPYQPNRPVSRKLSDAAMKLSPATWVTPAILRLHNTHEYKKDRRRVEEQYQAHRHEQLIRKRMYNGQDGTSYTDAPPSKSSTMTSTTLTPGMGRGSGITARSEMNLPRARALEWAGSTSCFSPGLLQPWNLAAGEEEFEGDESHLGPMENDPWLLPPIEEVT